MQRKQKQIECFVCECALLTCIYTCSWSNVCSILHGVECGCARMRFCSGGTKMHLRAKPREEVVKQFLVLRKLMDKHQWFERRAHRKPACGPNATAMYRVNASTLSMRLGCHSRDIWVLKSIKICLVRKHEGWASRTTPYNITQPHLF